MDLKFNQKKNFIILLTHTRKRILKVFFSIGILLHHLGYMGNFLKIVDMLFQNIILDIL